MPVLRLIGSTLEVIVTAAVQQVVDSFDALSEGDKHQAAVEILRRFARDAAGDLAESTLVEAADELFGALDKEETANALG
jgi:hypothetical protein